MKATVVTHIYNEEFLLPFWIRHHLKRFDHGVVINYASTDKSKAIIENLAPTWTVIESPFADFDAAKLDELVESIEANIEGVKIALTTTEFFMGNPREIRDDPEFIHSIDLVAKDFGQTFQSDVEFHKQFPFGLSEGDSKKIRPNELGRALHVKPISYTPGRHFKGNFGDKAILRVANCLVNDEMINRRLQIQNRIPAEDIKLGRGIQHHGQSAITFEHLLELRDNLSQIAMDLTDELERIFLLDEITNKSDLRTIPHRQLVRLSEIRYDLQSEVFELSNRVATAEASTEIALGRLRQAETALEAVISSHSWKVTTALRSLYRGLEFVRKQFFK